MGEPSRPRMSESRRRLAGEDEGDESTNEGEEELLLVGEVGELAEVRDNGKDEGYDEGEESWS